MSAVGTKRKVPRVTRALLEAAAAGDARARAIVVGRHLTDLGTALADASPPVSVQHVRLINAAWETYQATAAERRLDFLRMLDLRADVAPIGSADSELEPILRAWPFLGRGGPKAGASVWDLIAAWWTAHRRENVSPAAWRKMWSQRPRTEQTRARPRRRREK